MKGEKSAATLTIHRAQDMDRNGRRRVARWIKQQADLLLKDWNELAPRYTAKYLYRDE